jgi:hypothetical protein
MARHKEIILRDLSELILAASSDLEKAVVSLGGSILEGILFGFLKGQESYITAMRGQPFEVDPGESLQTYINIFNRYFGNHFPKGLISDIVVTYRDLIHVSREVSTAPGFCSQAAQDLPRILNGLLSHLAEFTQPRDQVS